MRSFLIFSILLLKVHWVFAQLQAPKSGGNEAAADGLSFLPIPYFNYDRSLEYQFGFLPLAIYPLDKNDTISPASATGLFGMYTTNESWFAMFFNQMYLDEDNWRITLAGGYGSVNFQFYLENPVNQFIKYNTGANFLFAMVQRRLTGKLYGGLNFVYSEVSTSLADDPDSATVPLSLVGAGAVLAMDKRDDVYYPKNGFLSNLTFFTFPESFGNRLASNKIDLDFNRYLGVRQNKDVLAGRIYVGMGLGEVAFQQQYIVGFKDIRGYSEGGYRGDQLYAIQGEYRWNFLKIWSLVAYGGLATVNGAINDSDNWKLLPAAGGGFRINVAPKYHFNVGMDAAVGIDDWGLYFRIGEAF